MRYAQLKSLGRVGSGLILILLALKSVFAAEPPGITSVGKDVSMVVADEAKGDPAAKSDAGAQAEKAAVEPVDPDGLKVGGKVVYSLGWQNNQAASIFPPEGLLNASPIVSRKTQMVLNLNMPRTFSAVIDAQYDQRPFSGNFGRVNQLNAVFDLGNSFKMRVGKQRVLWGRGFIYVPTDLINPPLDPSGLDLAKVGVSAVSFDYINTNYSVSTLVRREKNGIDSGGVKFSPSWRSGLDLDFIFYHAPSIGNAAGVSFAADAEQLISQNLTGVVIFGGFAQHSRSRYPEMQSQIFTDANGNSTPFSAVAARGQPGKYNSFLLGASYQTAGNLLYLGEYYHIGDAYSKDQFGRLLSALSDKGSLRQGLQAPWLNHLSFGRNQRNYMSLSINKSSLTDGFSRLTDTFTVELAMLRSLDDRSGLNQLSLISNYWDRAEVSLRTLFPYGKTATEFGGSPYKWYAELGIKIAF